jgi:hypothetical protein
LEQNI